MEIKEERFVSIIQRLPFRLPEFRAETQLDGISTSPYPTGLGPALTAQCQFLGIRSEEFSPWPTLKKHMYNQQTDPKSQPC